MVRRGRGTHDDLAGNRVVFEIDALEDVVVGMGCEERFEIGGRDIGDADRVVLAVQGESVFPEVVGEFVEDRLAGRRDEALLLFWLQRGRWGTRREIVRWRSAIVG